MTDMIVEEADGHAVESGLDGVHLGEDVDAVALLIDHAMEDRRVKTLARTPEGERLARYLDESLSQPPESLSRLSPHDQEQLLRLLNKVFGPSG
jgi:hypothetical protein